MRLCILSTFPPQLSGRAHYCWYIANGLAERERFTSITVLAETDETDSPEMPSLHPNVTVRRVWRRGDVGNITRIMQALTALRPDVLWLNAGMAMFGRSRPANFLGLATPLLARRAGIPVVTTTHEIAETVQPHDIGLQNGRFTQWGTRLATRMLLASDVVCVTLQHYAHLLRARYGAQNIEHFPVGAFTQVEWLPRPAGAPPLDLLFFACHAPYRGLGVLLEAFNLLQRQFPAATLTIAGSDHPRFPGYLANMRASINGQPGLRWLGPQSEAQVRELFAQTSLVVIPYLATTGASSVLYRAAAFGRPVVASDLPDIRVTTSEAGLRVDLVRPGDAHGLAEAIGQLLADPQRQQALAEHNLNAARATTLAQTCARYEALLASLARRC
jgi:glycosyltransferase involved in cell wall biosynthesis